MDCKPGQPWKVVSIFGNTADGKSHTSTTPFMSGRPSTPRLPGSPAPWECGRARPRPQRPSRRCGGSPSQTTPLLLRGLATSDLAVLGTGADGLRHDPFKGLGGASAAYLKYFPKDLMATLPAVAWMSPCPRQALLLSFSRTLSTRVCWALISPRGARKAHLGPVPEAGWLLRGLRFHSLQGNEDSQPSPRLLPASAGFAPPPLLPGTLEPPPWASAVGLDVRAA